MASTKNQKKGALAKAKRRMAKRSGKRPKRKILKLGRIRRRSHQRSGRVSGRRWSPPSRVNSRRGVRRFRAYDIDLNKLKEPKSMSDVKFNIFIKRVLKKVKPRLRINGDSMRIMDKLMKDTLHQIAMQAASKMGRRKVLVPKVIIRGMKQILPKAFRAKADERAQKALSRYLQSKRCGRR